MAHKRPVKTVRLPAELVDEAAGVAETTGWVSHITETDRIDWNRTNRMSAARVIEEAVVAGLPIIKARIEARKRR